jgi:hypothetical protein
MTINEESRHRLHQRLEQVLGDTEAGTLMELLPPVGWADVATKHDLAALEERIGLRFAPLELRLDHLEVGLADLKADLKHEIEGRFSLLETHFSELRADFRTTMLTVLSVMVVLVGAVIAAVKL